MTRIYRKKAGHSECPRMSQSPRMSQNSGTLGQTFKDWDIHNVPLGIKAPGGFDSPLGHWDKLSLQRSKNNGLEEYAHEAYPPECPYLRVCTRAMSQCPSDEKEEDRMDGAEPIGTLQAEVSRIVLRQFPEAAAIHIVVRPGQPTEIHVLQKYTRTWVTIDTSDPGRKENAT